MWLACVHPRACISTHHGCRSSWFPADRTKRPVREDDELRREVLRVLPGFLGSAARCVFGRKRERRRPGPKCIWAIPLRGLETICQAILPNLDERRGRERLTTKQLSVT